MPLDNKPIRYKSNPIDFGLLSNDNNIGSIDTSSLFNCFGAAITCDNDNTVNNNLAINNGTNPPPDGPPIADAGPDQTISSGATVQLDGSGSSDPSGNSLTYQWIQISGPAVVLDSATSSSPSFESPITREQVQLVFQLTVTNEQGVVSEPDTVTITATSFIIP